ncbi:MAG TPA: zf-HC2 domain-containing protein [Fimbriimonadaceae bacterium]|nr:zf-HC2 domain-containing protein [Fimbriimonadaceae bacterium]
MQAKTLECQLAQAQLGRYLAGEMISPEAEQQLEAHVSECPLCKQEVNLRKQALQAAANGFAVINAPEGKAPKNPKSVRINLLDAAKERKSPLTKPVVLSSALAAVLYAMSVFANDPSKVFGPRLSENPTPTPAVSTPPVVDASIEKPKTEVSQPLGPTRPEGWVEPTPSSDPEPVINAPKPASTPPAAVSIPTRKRQPSVRRTQAPAGSSGIRVYDPNGQPLGGN